MDHFHTEHPTRFLFPIDGDFVNERDGERCGDGVEIVVCVSSTKGCHVTVNGADAQETDDGYRAKAYVRAGENRLLARNETDGSEDAVQVYFAPQAVGKWRISSDDNILFLADITAHKEEYTSIFDNPYLAVYRKAHELYGAKVHLNLFYSFDRVAAANFGNDRPDFDLSMMTDRFRAEWEENADWLKLSFHAYAEHPDRPYKNASPERITADFLAVKREVVRFAGEKTFSNDVTTIHFGEANPACVAALRDLGHKALTGYFELDESGNPLVAYYAPVELTLHVGERDFWRDTAMGMSFGRIDRVTNIGTIESVMADMEQILHHPHRGGFVSIMIHEQYFYQDYVGYLADFEKRVLLPAKLLYENGYTGAFVKDVLP